MTALAQRLLDLAAAATYLGITPRQLKDLRHRGIIPATKLGPKTLRFDVHDLDRHIERCKEVAS
jgi:excisionase family DNA binding protein